MDIKNMPDRFPYLPKANGTPPFGTIMLYAGTATGSHLEAWGWMICDGRTLPIAEYPQLFVALGEQYGRPDEAHFNIPDLRNSFVAGKGEINYIVRFL